MARSSSRAAPTTFISTIMTAVKAVYSEAPTPQISVTMMKQITGRNSTTGNSINIINQLQSAIYTVQLMHNDEIMNTRSR